MTKGKQNLYLSLTLVTALLFMQSVLAGHHHSDKATTGEHCQLCLHAQHYNPAPPNQVTVVLVIFSYSETIESVETKLVTPTFYLFNYSRAPPSILA